MKDLGKKRKEIYDSPGITKSESNKIDYPEISLPLEIIEGMNLKVDDDVVFTCKGRISGMEDTKWSRRVSIEAKEGEIKKAGKKGESVLAEA